MTAITFRGWPIILGVLLCVTRTLSAQTLHAGFGVGPTPVVGGGHGNRNWTGIAGYQSRGAFGVRASGSETAQRLWLSADLTYRLHTRSTAVRPYALAGLGYVLDLGENDPLVTAGTGLRVQLGRLLFAFGEVKLHRILGTPASGPRSILPLTLGIGIGR
jgi:hypothetical protein